MADDSLEALMLFRPRIACRRSEADPYPGPRFASPILRLQAARLGGRTGRSNFCAKGSTDVCPPGPLPRRCVIKARFVSAGGKGQKAARLHLSYLERDGVERDGSPRTLYGRDDRFDPASMREPLDTENRQFRFIVSLEDAGELDLRTCTRDLVAQMEKDLGRRLICSCTRSPDCRYTESESTTFGRGRGARRRPATGSRAKQPSCEPRGGKEERDR